MVSAVQNLPPVAVRSVDDTPTANRNDDTLKAEKENISAKSDTQSASSENKTEKKNVGDINELADKLTQNLGGDNVSFKFSVDKDTKQIILKLLDTETKEVIGQYPPEISLKIARMLASNEKSGGFVTDSKV